jgi:hypothetical protein
MGRTEVIVGATAIALLLVAGVVGVGWVAWKVATTPPREPLASTPTDGRRAPRDIPEAVTKGSAPEQFPWGVNGDLVKSLRPKRAACMTAVEHMLAIGFYKHETTTKSGSIWMQINEPAWHRLDYDDKVRQALLIYCARMPQNGDLTVTLEGSKSGSILGRVVGGNWMP